MDLDTVLATLFDLISPHLNQRQRRLLLGVGTQALAAAAGRGWPASTGGPAPRCTPGA